MKNVDRLFILTAQNYTAHRDCTILVHAFGASGSGALSNGNPQGASTGGGAGARCTKKVRLKAGESLTLTPGTGGAGQTSAVAGITQGADGGDTTVTGPNSLSMVAGGGKGGKAVANSGAVAGGAGGIATGGDVNVTGGRGGNIIAATANSYRRATGGGAMPILDEGQRGGDVANPNATDVITGGAGIGGHGGDAVTSAVVGPIATGGGSAHSSASDAIGGGGYAGAISTLAYLTDWLSAAGPSGGAGVASTTPIGPVAGPGGGSGGVCATNAANANVGVPGIFGGIGGCGVSIGSANTTFATAVPLHGLYGGSGGVISTGVTTLNSLAGGNGFILLEVFP